jgi:hypothetical protein
LDSGKSNFDQREKETVPFYQLVNDTPVPGIYSKNNSWNLLDIGFNNRISYYYLKDNNKYLIGSDGWVYYYD